VPRTLLTFHAHPDDEAIATCGVMAQAAARGDRVVLVVATKGEHAGFGHGLLAEGELMSERRVAETLAAAEIIGCQRVEFLGYVDSGMAGTPENDAPGSFWSADVEEAARRLADILVEEHVDAVTAYLNARRDKSLPGDIEVPDVPDPESFDLGLPESQITTVVNVREFIDVKRAAMAAHASQIDEASWFLQLPPEDFAEAFGYEWFVRRGAPPGTKESSLFDDDA
jgi:LmbE family N-acetylglucosaminyl deacetylase